jgi:hypothetical protein
VIVEEAIADVVEAIESAGITRPDGGAMTVVDYDATPDTLDRPVACTVSFGALTDTDIGVDVRLFFDTSSDVKSAEQLARTITPAVDTALDDVPAPRSTWNKSWSNELSCFVVTTTLAMPREDF